MSSIPSSAMPHAKAEGSDDQQSGENQKEGRRASIKKGASKLKDKAKENPKTAIAASTAVVAGAVAAAALAVRKKSAGTKSAGTKSAGAKSTGSKSGSKSADTKSDGRKSKSTS